MAQGRGQAATNGPVPRYDASIAGGGKWPAYWDGKWFVGDFYDGDQPRNAVLTDPKTAGDGGCRWTRRP